MKHSRNFIDLTNKKFGRITVLKFAKTNSGRTYWVCKCKCGNLKEIEGYTLRSGQTKSCGCLATELKRKRKTRLSHGMSGTRIHNIWIQMRNRCQNKNNQAYKYYGGRGISVDERWNIFENFLNDMGELYSQHITKYSKKQTTIDRIDNEKGYCKRNCRWATYKEQMKNKRVNRELLSKAGKLGAIARWGK